MPSGVDIFKLSNWDKNPRGIKKDDFERNSMGQFIKGIIPHNKGKGMTEIEKKEARKMAVKKSNLKRAEKIKQWHKDNLDRVNEIKRKYAKSDIGKQKTRENAQRRLERVKKLTKTINWTYWKWLCKKLDYKCQLCLKTFPYEKLTLDHQLPINRGGDNDEWNLQPLCKSCNSSKQDRLIGIDNVYLDLAYGDWLLEQKYANN